jgi:hypothetical protein
MSGFSQSNGGSESSNSSADDDYVERGHRTRRHFLQMVNIQLFVDLLSVQQ